MDRDDVRTRARRVRDQLDESYDRANVELMDRHIAALADPRRAKTALAELARISHHGQARHGGNRTTGEEKRAARCLRIGQVL